MPYQKTDVGHRLKVLRVKARMTQDDLAKMAGLDKTSIAKYEAGEVSPGLDKAYSMALALGCSIDEIAGLPAPDERWR